MNRGVMFHLNFSSYFQNNALSPALFIYFIFILDYKFIVSHNKEADSILDQLIFLFFSHLSIYLTPLIPITYLYYSRRKLILDQPKIRRFPHLISISFSPQTPLLQLLADDLSLPMDPCARVMLGRPPYPTILVAGVIAPVATHEWM